MAEACLNLSGTISTNCSALEFPCRLHFFSFRAKLFRKKLCFKGKSKISLIERQQNRMVYAINSERYLICTTVVATRVTGK